MSVWVEEDERETFGGNLVINVTFLRVFQRPPNQYTASLLFTSLLFPDKKGEGPGLGPSVASRRLWSPKLACDYVMDQTDCKQVNLQAID